MPDNLRAYTVSAVVNTDTGELVGTPIVRAGHEDYDQFSTVNPLAASEQFRWVHVRAPDAAAAAAIDTLTADLRPGGDRNRPVARALTGDSGLKRYSVAGAVHARTGRPIGAPVVAEGHQTLVGAAFTGRTDAHAFVANVWACDGTDAVAQVFGTDLDTDTVHDAVAGLRAVGARGDPNEPRRSVALDVAAVAHREWTRLTELPADARAALVADAVWNREYPTAYRIAYIAAAARIAARTVPAAAANPDAWSTLQRLAAAAGHVMGKPAAELAPVPPADHRTVAAAQAASAQSGKQPPWQRVADLAAIGSRTAGALAGTLTATTDVLVGWRSRSGHALCEGITVDGQPARAWIGNLLATVNGDTAATIFQSGGTNTNGVVAASVRRRTVSQLAREDQAPGTDVSTAASRPHSVIDRRVRPAVSPALNGAQRTR